jgi:hypothetical protein
MAPGLTDAAIQSLRAVAPRCGAVQSSGRARREIDAQSRAENGGQDSAAERQENRRPAAWPTAHLAPPGARVPRAGAAKYPPRACFITSPDATTTCVAREVKLYLALRFSLFLRALPR